MIPPPEDNVCRDCGYLRTITHRDTISVAYRCTNCGQTTRETWEQS